jgi:hypothetical protein
MRSDFNFKVNEMCNPDINTTLTELTEYITKVMADNCKVSKYKVKANILIPEWASGKYFMLNKRIENIEGKICKLLRMHKPTSKLIRIQNSVKDELKRTSESMARNYYGNLIKNNAACSWVVVNKILGKTPEDRKKIILTKDNVLIRDDTSVAELLPDYFGQTVSVMEGTSVKPFFIGATQINSMFFDAVTYDEVFEVVMSLDSNKYPGSDSITTKILKEIVNELTAPLTDLINMIVMTSTYPVQMKYAHVIPLFKSGDKSSPKNYRGISLLNILNKIVEKLILKRISDFMKQKKLRIELNMAIERNLERTMLYLNLYMRLQLHLTIMIYL